MTLQYKTNLEIPEQAKASFNRFLELLPIVLDGGQPNRSLKKRRLS
jgi:hypothetical protein